MLISRSAVYSETRPLRTLVTCATTGTSTDGSSGSFGSGLCDDVDVSAFAAVAGTAAATPAAAATAELRLRNCLRLVDSMVFLLGVARHASDVSELQRATDDGHRASVHIQKHRVCEIQTSGQMRIPRSCVRA